MSSRADGGPSAIPAVDAPTVLAYVQAGGKGSRLDALTRERAKPALPVAGEYQLVDVALSNVANSGVRDAWVSVQYLAATLDAHLLGGKPWDLDGRRGGFRRIVPQEGGTSAVGEGFSGGSADDLFGALDQVAELAPDIVVVMSADQVMRVDLREHVARHAALRAELGHDVVTVLTVEVSEEQARQKTVLQLGDQRRVLDVHDKPDEPASTTISAEVVIFDRELMREALEEVRRDLGHGEEPTLGDLAEHVLPWLADQQRLHADPLPGYWRDLGRPEYYLEAHRDILQGRCTLFEDTEWPMVTNVFGGAPARFREGCEVTDSMVSRGCDVRGTVRGSVLGPGVVVEAGAVVEDSVLFGGVVVAEGARVATSVIDEGVRIAQRVSVGGLHEGPVSPEQVTLVGRGSQLSTPGAVIEPGARLEPGTTV